MGLIRDVLSLMRGINLLIILLCQLLVSLFLFDKEPIALIQNVDYIFLLISTVLIAAGGNVINDYYDVKIDVINKPSKVKVGLGISRMQTIMLHYTLNFTALIFAYLVSWKLAAFDLGIISALWLYSLRLKCIPFIGNMVVSILTALVIYILVIFFKEDSNQILAFCYFAFMLSMIREIVKDIQDMKGDQSNACRTLPIAIGIPRTRIIAFIIAVFHLLGLMMVMFVSQNDVFKIYFLVAVILPSVALTIQLFRAENKKQLNTLSNLIKLAMFCGIMSSIFL